MNQRITIPMDHGNRNLKTAQHVFTSGLIESDCKPVLGDYLYYNGRYYTLSEQRIPYMRDTRIIFHCCRSNITDRIFRVTAKTQH